MKSNRITICVILTSLAAGLALAQSFVGEIRGLIEDPGGAIIAGANVSLKNESTGTVVSTVTTAAGQYVFAQLEPATYTITVQVQGFKRLVRPGVIVGVQEKVGLDLKMELGDVTQSIAVTAEAPLIESATASNGTVTDSQQIQDLPNLGRNTFLLSKVDNNVVPSGPPQWNRFQDQIGSSRLSINGGPIAGNNYLVDGVPVTSSQNLAMFIPEQDSVQEMKLQEDTYDATMGRTGGGMFNVVLKTGGNSLHGDVMGYLRTTDLTANSFFNNAAGRHADGTLVDPRPSEKWENWGATLGGPVYIPKIYDGRNKTFFFASTEGYLEAQPATGSYAVPTAAELTGNFSGQKTIYDPMLNVTGANGSVTRSPFANNIIPPNRINPVGQAILSYLPRPQIANAAVDTNNFTGEDTLGNHAEEHVFKLEEAPASWLRLSGSFVYYKSHEPGGNTLETLPGSGSYLLDRHVDATAVNAIATLNPTTVVTARFGFNRFPNIYNYVSKGFDQSTLGFPASYVNSLQVKEFPVISLSQAGFSFGGTSPSNETYWSRNASFALSKNVGKHNLTMGFDYRLIHTDGISWTLSEGGFTFNGIFTSQTNQSATTGVDFADALLGAPSSGTVQANSDEYFYVRYYSGFVQDDIRVTNKLTINAGLRYEYETGEAEQFNNMLVGFNQSAYNPIQASLPAGSGVNAYGLPLIAGQNSNPTACCNALKDKFGPRAGFAYQINDKTVFRGGYGVFYAPIYFSFDNQYSPGLAPATTYLASTDGNATPANTLSNPYPKGVAQPQTIQAGVLQQLGGPVYFADQHRTQGLIQQFSADVQRQLPWGIALELGYSGARSRDLQMGSTSTAYLPLNQVPTQYLGLGSALSGKVANPFTNVGGVLAGSTVAQAQLLMPFPEYQQVYDSNNLGHANYDSMIVKVNKRMSRGLTFLYTFTWSKNEDNTYGGAGSNYFISNSGSTAPAYPQNVYNLGAEWSLAAGTTPWRSAAAWTYELPFGKGKQFASSVPGALDYVIGGWAINGVMTLSTGFPLFVYQTNNNSTIGTLEQRPNATGTSPDKSGSPESRINQYFNPAAFSMAPAYTFGNLSRSIPMYGPGLANWDISLFKTVTIKERFKAQFRAEALNAFNTPLFANPNVNFQGFKADGVTPNGNFGKITYQMNLPRELQLGLRFSF